MFTPENIQQFFQLIFSKENVPQYLGLVYMIYTSMDMNKRMDKVNMIVD